MKTPLLLSSLLLVALTGMAGASVPKKAPLSHYERLWKNSVFTSPPAPIENPKVDPFQNYALIGVSPLENNGYRVTLINRTQPDERITVDSGRTKDGFSVVSVDHETGNPLGTVVRMKSGSLTGTVRFDEKLLAPVAPKPAAAQRPNSAVQPGQPQQPQLKAAPRSTPRLRVVPPNP